MMVWNTGTKGIDPRQSDVRNPDRQAERNGHGHKTLFFLNPSIDLPTRTRLLREDFCISATDIAKVNLDGLLALRVTSPEQLILIVCAKPERDAYLVAALRAFEDIVARKK